MNLLRIITREEAIAGLEINDNWLRLTLLKLTSKDKTKLEIKVSVEMPLNNGVIGDGRIKIQNELVKSLKELLKKAKTKIRYVIVSVPVQAVYSRVFTFPKTVQGIKLDEAMNLIINFQLPLKASEVYLDWERVASGEFNKVFFAAAPRTIIDEYLKAFELSGLKPVAIEFHPMSFSRVADWPENNAVMITASDKTKTEIFVVKNKTVYFSRVVLFSRLPKKLFKDEIRKITDFYESENDKITQTIDISGSKATAMFQVGALAKKDRWKWFISAGAAWRGLLARGDDTIVSLMPVGTEDVYEYQKATTFVGFLSGVAITLATFFVVVFIAAWMLMVAIQRNTLNRIDSLTAAPAQGELMAMEDKAKQFNGLVGATGSLLKVIPNWSILLEELKSRVTNGVIITELSLPSTESILTIKGSAGTRQQLNSFKKSLDESRLLSEVKLPLTNLEQKENIPFSISFKLKE